MDETGTFLVRGVPIPKPERRVLALPDKPLTFVERHEGKYLDVEIGVSGEGYLVVPTTDGWRMADSLSEARELADEQMDPYGVPVKTVGRTEVADRYFGRPPRSGDRFYTWKGDRVYTECKVYLASEWTEDHEEAANALYAEVKRREEEYAARRRAALDALAKEAILVDRDTLLRMGGTVKPES